MVRAIPTAQCTHRQWGLQWVKLGGECDKGVLSLIVCFDIHYTLYAMADGVFCEEVVLGMTYSRTGSNIMRQLELVAL